MATQTLSDGDIDGIRLTNTEAIENTIKLCLKDITVRFSNVDVLDTGGKTIRLEFSTIGDSPLGSIAQEIELQKVGHFAWASDRFVDLSLFDLGALGCSAFWSDGHPIASFRSTKASLIALIEQRDALIEQPAVAEEGIVLSFANCAGKDASEQDIASETLSTLLDPIETADPQSLHHLPFSLPPIPHLLRRAGELFFQRSEAVKSIPLVDNAIACYERIVRLTHPLDSREEYLTCMDKAVQVFFSRRAANPKDRLDLPETDWRIARMARFAKASYNDDEQQLPPTHFSILGMLLFWRYSITESLDDISNSISALERHVGLLAPGDAEYVEAVTHLCDSLSRRYSANGDVGDLNACIARFQDLLQYTSPGQPSARAELLARLASWYRDLSRSNGDVEDATRAVQYQREALALTPPGHPDHDKQRGKLADTLSSRSGLLIGNIDDSNEVVSIREAIVKSTSSASAGDSNVIQHLSDLASALAHRANLTTSLPDISRAISLLQTAIDAISPDSTSYDSLMLALQEAFAYRYFMTHSVSDWEASMVAREKVLQFQNSAKAEHLHSLGTGQLILFVRKGGIENLSTAIDNLKASIDLTQKGDPRLPNRLVDLALGFFTKYDEMGDISDLNATISTHERAVAATPDTSIHFGFRLATLAWAVEKRYNDLGNQDDLHTAISMCQKALACMSQHPKIPGDQAFVESQLANLFVSRFSLTRNAEDSKAAFALISPMIDDSALRMSRRLLAAHKCADWSLQAGDGERAMRYGAAVIDLLAQATYLEQTIRDRYLSIRDHYMHRARCPGYAFYFGHLETGLEWLEQGRCLIWSQISQLQTPYDELRVQHPDLADKLEQAGKLLRLSESRQQPANLSDTLTVNARQVQKHTDAVQEWRQALREIRQVEEFNNFLKPPTAKSLLERLPEEGVIVTFSVLEYGRFALALVAGRGIVRVPLPDFSDNMASTLQDRLQAHLQKTDVLTRSATRALAWEGGDEDPERLTSVLADLWWYVVKPVMDVLGFKPMLPDSPRPRVWWCPTGQLSFLPLHAAGVYGDDYAFGSCISDYVISSYTPSVTILLDKLDESSRHAASSNRLLLVSQPDTPGLAPIPATTEETRAIKDIVDGVEVPCVLLEREDATLTEVTAAMKTHSWVHFACHASQIANDPFASGIHLHDGRLELLEMIKDQSPNTDHIFLSACQTSTGDKDLAEEVMHVAASMLAAGFRSAVATMWSISDRYGPVVARLFYQHIVEGAAQRGDPTRMDGTQSAHALDHAVRKLREEVGDGEEGLLTWVPYTHLGI